MVLQKNSSAWHPIKERYGNICISFVHEFFVVCRHFPSFSQQLPSFAVIFHHFLRRLPPFSVLFFKIKSLRPTKSAGYPGCPDSTAAGPGINIKVSQSPSAHVLSDYRLSTLHGIVHHILHCRHGLLGKHPNKWYFFRNFS